MSNLPQITQRPSLASVFGTERHDCEVTGCNVSIPRVMNFCMHHQTVLRCFFRDVYDLYYVALRDYLLAYHRGDEPIDDLILTLRLYSEKSRTLLNGRERQLRQAQQHRHHN